jgi:hypothetical protein
MAFTIRAYTAALEKMFTVGSKLMEERCAQALCANVGVTFMKKDSYSLREYVEDAKKRWLLGETKPSA